MNKYFVVLFSVLSVANAGIYSAKWSANAPVKPILRSSPELQQIDSSSPLITPESAQKESSITKFEEDSEDIFRSAVNPVETSDSQITSVETLDTPASAQIQESQIGLEDIESSQYITIGSVYNESPNTNIEEQTQYKPKRVRSVTLVQESESSAPTKNIEARETPASTIRTPNHAYYPTQTRNQYQPSNLAYPAAPTYNYYGPGGYPGHLDHHQSTISPLNNLPIHHNPINVPSYQSIAIAQNSPGFEFAAASASSNGLANGVSGSAIGTSAVSVAQNYGGVQSASSFANIGGQASVITASRNDGKQSSSVAQALNQNASGSKNTVVSSNSSPPYLSAVSYTGKN